MVKNQQQHKEEETKSLIQFAEVNNLWVDNINIDLYVSQGAEQKVYLKDGSTVLKLNDYVSQKFLKIKKSALLADFLIS